MRDERILAFNPWEGDTDSDAVTLRDQMVRARVKARCAICFGSILKGDRVRAQTQRSDEQRKVMTFRFCVDCCDEMANDDGSVKAFDRMAKRYALGQARANAKRTSRDGTGEAPTT